MKSATLSVAIHILIGFSIFISSFQSLELHEKISHKIITITQVSEEVQPTPSTQESEASDKEEALFQKSTVIKHTSKAVSNNLNPNKYEQILSTHIQNYVNNSKLLTNQLNSKIKIWIKVSKNGDLLDFGIIGAQKSGVENYISKVLKLSSPLPTPPKKDLSANYAVYMISLIKY